MRSCDIELITLIPTDSKFVENLFSMSLIHKIFESLETQHKVFGLLCSQCGVCRIDGYLETGRREGGYSV